MPRSSASIPDEEAPQAAEDGAEGEPLEDDTERLKDLASEAPVIRLVNQIITRAVETHASDIHIEPFEDRLRVRYRYDGMLHEADSPPRRLAAAITSRIKIMAKLDIAERRLPQDGRIKLAVRGQEIDFRVSTIPSLYRRNRRAAHPRPQRRRVRLRAARPAADGDPTSSARRWSCRTASCW